MNTQTTLPSVPTRRPRDLTGMVFGDLTVLRRLEPQGKNKGIRWLCQCTCGAHYATLGTHLVTGKRTVCTSRVHPKNYATVDISGQTFGDLTALEPTKKRDNKGFVIWKCRCKCGEEPLISYNELRYTNIRSCGCRKRAHHQKLKEYLTHVDGTSLEMLKSKKIPTDNTTGCKGVYFIRGKYVAKIVFQKKAYYLGTYDNIEAAAAARKEGEALLFDGFTAFYQQWKQKADKDPQWAEANPIRIHAENDRTKGLTVTFEPQL